MTYDRGEERVWGQGQDTKNQGRGRARGRGQTAGGQGQGHKGTGKTTIGLLSNIKHASRSFAKTSFGCDI